MCPIAGEMIKEAVIKNESSLGESVDDHLGEILGDRFHTCVLIRRPIWVTVAVKVVNYK